MMRKFYGALLGIFVLASAFAPARAEEPRLLAYAAASLTDVLSKVGADYEADTGKGVTFSFAASSAIARQIEAGAPAQMVFSADEQWMDYLSERHLIDLASRHILAMNRLVLIAPKSSGVAFTIAKDASLADALGDGRLAIADPSSVPAGRYAKEALTTLNIWTGVEGKLVQSENVRVALSYVARDEAPLGIVYETDARAEPKVRIVDTFPESSHQPVVYPVALTTRAGKDAVAFMNYLTQDKAKETFKRAGFILPAAR
ncbi:MAG: molybdate ABC transporter substrate-binding protein [Parvibaculum sp.]|nr:molybdate ABC transporter substrate-binding protein [Parvibaculum sp.]